MEMWYFRTRTHIFPLQSVTKLRLTETAFCGRTLLITRVTRERSIDIEKTSETERQRSIKPSSSLSLMLGDCHEVSIPQNKYEGTEFRLR